MSSDTFGEFIRHNMSMRRLTRVELVNTYWQGADQIATTGRLGFIIRGNASWKSDRPEGIDSNGLWLRSNRYEPVGKHIAEQPVQTYLQWYMNTYEIWGTIAIDIDPNDAVGSKPLIEQALSKAMLVSNAMSLLYGVSLRWYPARYVWLKHTQMPPPPERAVEESWACLPLQRSQEEQTSTVLEDRAIEDELLPFINEVQALPPSIRTAITTAIDWHSMANRYDTGLNRFVNYWESIELLGNFFYDELPSAVVKRQSPKEKQRMIINLLSKEVTQSNCMKVVERCSEIRMPTARTKVLAFLDIITDRDRMEKALFKAADRTSKSLYQIRSDIAHGKISEHDFEAVEMYGRRLSDARQMSFGILMLTIKNAGKLDRLIRNG